MNTIVRLYVEQGECGDPSEIASVELPFETPEEQEAVAIWMRERVALVAKAISFGQGENPNAENWDEVASEGFDRDSCSVTVGDVTIRAELN